MRSIVRTLTALFACCVWLPATAADTVSVQAAWTRATPPGAVNSATYVELHNLGERARTIVAMHSSAVSEVQIHSVIHEDGLMKMRQLKHIELPAGAVLELKPGGLHMMMLGVKQPLRDGQSIEIELEFANGEKLSFVSPIQRMATIKEMDHSQMKHD